MSAAARSIQLIDRTPLPAALALGLVVIGLAWGWAIVEIQRPIQPPPSAPSLQAAAPTHSSAPDPDDLVIPDAVWTVTLADELFPEPPPPPPEESPYSPPAVAYQLIAITGAGDGRRAFIHDPSLDAYHDLAPGQTLAPGVRLARIDDRRAELTIGDRRIILELAP